MAGHELEHICIVFIHDLSGVICCGPARLAVRDRQQITPDVTDDITECPLAMMSLCMR